MKVYVVIAIAAYGDEQVIRGVFSDRVVAKARARHLLTGRVHNTRVEEWGVDGSPGESEVFGDED